MSLSAPSIAEHLIEGRPIPQVTIEEFHAKVKNLTLTAACGREYVRVTKLQEWLRDRCPSGSNSRMLDLLYAGPWSTNPQQLRSPVHHHVLESEGLILLSILIELEQTQYLEQFWQHDICGSKIPASLDDLYKKLESANIPDSKRLADRFYERQWKFCPVVFHYSDVKQYNPRQILPIVRKKLILDNNGKGKGGTAELAQIEVLEEFVGKRLREQVPDSCYELDNGLGVAYQFALKTFKAENSSHYQREKRAFDSIQDLDGIVKCLNKFKHDEIKPGTQHDSNKPLESPITTYNLLLEYGDRDLETFFAQTHPPFLEPEIVSFWKEIFKVVKAVRSIHNYKNPDNRFRYKGWHADIKPDNILLVENKCKLADFGFARFVPETEQARAYLAGATWTYSAPEHLPGHTEKVTQAIDIWSLGCVFSIAATWVVGGYSTVRDYARVRQKAIEESKKRHRSALADVPAGDLFCDGTTVLDEVGQWHRVLRRTASRADNMTGLVLDIVDQHMLRARPTDRWSCKQLDDALEQIVRDNPVDSNSQLPMSILRALQDINDEAAQNPQRIQSSASKQRKSESTGSAKDRKDAKAYILSTPLKKTAYRAEYLDAVIGPSCRVQVSLSSRSVPESNPQQLSRTDTLKPDLPTPPRPGPLVVRRDPPHEPVDIFQAYYQIEQQKRGFDPASALRRLGIHFRPKKIKEEHLAEYIQNCDIKFLVDNSWSMLRHWAQAAFMLRILAVKGSPLDDNGMDLSFTRKGGVEQNKRSGDDLAKIMWEATNKPIKDEECDMGAALGRVLRQYSGSLQPERRSKRLLLIVLTDGTWKDMTNKDEVRTVIRDFYKNVEWMLGPLEARTIGIEFVQFGDDPEATDRLQFLDDYLSQEHGIKDIIDTEPAHGDINKIFLGSLVEHYDNLEHLVLSPTTSQQLKSGAERTDVEGEPASRP